MNTFDHMLYYIKCNSLSVYLLYIIYIRIDNKCCYKYK